MKLIGYLSNGYPTFDKSFEMAKIYHKAGIDTVQIDFPAAEPYLEGPHIASRMQKALGSCKDYQSYMNNIAKIHSEIPSLNILLLTYENTITAIGIQHFIHFCLRQNLLDITCIGNTKPEIKETLMSAELRISSYIQFHQDINEIVSAEQTNGFIYLQAKPQTNPAQLKRKTLKECIQHLRSHFGENREIYTGVGLRTPKDIIEARIAGSNGAFIGSSIIKQENNLIRLIKTIKEFKKASCTKREKT